MSEQPCASVASIYRYPVKGLTPEPLTEVALTPGQPLPADRRYAIENGPIGFDPAAPQYFPKTQFLMLMRNERLAALRSHYDDASHTLTIRQDNSEAVRADLRTAEGRAEIEAFFAGNFADELRGPPKVLFADGHSFSDVPRKVVSIINLASVADLEKTVGQPVHPLRFRGNLHVTGWPAWHEFELIDRTLAIGGTRLKVVKRIVRCAATNVDPDTAARDLTIPKTLLQTYGHADCGIYAEVITGGTIAAGDEIVAEE
ncbi:MOSC domain-containing protein [Tardiphaga sp.]|uniref:MOSC domain-containing protein n=1 Tax=Tardiphaga sp. TaxID=1926292 RepID=UPI00352B7E65